jgi:hypothetical protein
MSQSTPHLVCAKLILEIFMSSTYHVLVLQLEMYILMCGECIQTVQLALASPNLILKKLSEQSLWFSTSINSKGPCGDSGEATFTVLVRSYRSSNLSISTNLVLLIRFTTILHTVSFCYSFDTSIARLVPMQLQKLI